MRNTFCVVLAAAAALCTPSFGAAQIVFGDIGFQVSDQRGNAAGDACWGFSCRSHNLAVRRGAQLQSTVRAPLGSPYVVFIAQSAPNCLPIVGSHHEFVLSFPAFAPLFFGSVDERNTARFCYDGLKRDSLPLPPSLFGFSFALQAVAVAPNPSRVPWVWSSAVEIAIR